MENIQAISSVSYPQWSFHTTLNEVLRFLCLDINNIFNILRLDSVANLFRSWIFFRLFGPSPWLPFWLTVAAESDPIYRFSVECEYRFVIQMRFSLNGCSMPIFLNFFLIRKLTPGTRVRVLCRHNCWLFWSPIIAQWLFCLLFCMFPVCYLEQ